MSSRTSAALVACVLSGCQLIAGIGDRSSGPAGSQGAALSCSTRADCAGGELCLFGACSRTCRRDADCPAGQRCLGTDSGAACVPPSRAECSGAAGCPAGATCESGECRSECVDSSGCAEDQICSPSGACFGTSAAHDPSDLTDAGPGSSGGTSGAGGSSGASTGGAGAGGAGGASTGGTSTGGAAAGGSSGAGGASAGGAGGVSAGGASAGGAGGSSAGGSGGIDAGTGGSAAGGSGGVDAGAGGAGGVDAGAGGADGGVLVPSPTALPTPVEACPVLATGANAISLGGTSTTWRLWMGTPATAGAGGPIVVYWHSTGTNGSEATAALGPALQDVQNQGGVVAAPDTSSASGSTTGNNVWYTGDVAYADQVVACAVAQRLIDPRRIHVVGSSAGGLQAVHHAQARSGYVAGVVTYSGGLVVTNTVPFQDVQHVPSALAVHGAEGTDKVGLDFAVTSRSWEARVKGAGGFAIDCDDGGGHLASRTTMAPHAWQFLQDHPYGVKPEPYDAIPAGWPSYCSIP